jgi:hypothetical protein
MARQRPLLARAALAWLDAVNAVGVRKARGWRLRLAPCPITPTPRLDSLVNI